MIKPIARLLLCFTLLAPLGARAIPVLQLYIEGSSYDPVSESWVLLDATNPLRIWTIANLEGPGGTGGAAVVDAKLAVAYAAPDTGSVSITLTPSTTGGFGGFTDPSTPVAPTLIRTVTDGSTPTLGDGSSMPAHGVYGAGVHWQEFALGDFGSADSPVADFINAFPDTPVPSGAQINVYQVDVLGVGYDYVHFDFYDHYLSKNHLRVRFSPFSHDAWSINNSSVPEPGVVALLALGLLLAGRRRRARG